jgi:hypothetical protein
MPSPVQSQAFHTRPPLISIPDPSSSLHMGQDNLYIRNYSEHKHGGIVKEKAVLLATVAKTDA